MCATDSSDGLSLSMNRTKIIPQSICNQTEAAAEERAYHFVNVCLNSADGKRGTFQIGYSTLQMNQVRKGRWFDVNKVQCSVKSIVQYPRISVFYCPIPCSENKAHLLSPSAV